MASVYLAFLQSPTAAPLAENASINYITTTTTISEPAAILKHLASQSKQVEKKEEKVMHSIEGDNAVCLEVSTTLQFRMGGGAYLPSMDSNMLDEREVTFPLTHIVTFNAERKIEQVRLYWDQGTLLKQVEAIGKTGRNWPIREGKAQNQAVIASVKSSGAPASTAKSSNGRGPHDVVIREHAKRDSVSVTRDPHSSLNLFAERDPNEDSSNRSYTGPKHATRASAKPAPREYGELFASEGNSLPGSSARSTSPHKTDGTILKAGAGRHFDDNRLFDEKDDEDMPKSPERKKTYDQKYEHFAFGNGEDAAQQQQRRPATGKTQHKQTFSFEDFATPPKHVVKHRPDEERHWGVGIDAEDPSSPPKRPVVHAARPDAESHFELTDDSPAPVKKSLQREKGMGLYQDPLHADERTTFKKTNPAVNNTRRGDDFSAHYDINDKSPAGAAKAKPKGTQRSDMDAHWSFDSPAKERKIYKTAGDGMGSRSGARAWGIGDESDPEVENTKPAKNTSGRGRRAQVESGAERDF